MAISAYEPCIYPNGTCAFFTDATGHTCIMESSVTPAMIAFGAVIVTGIVVMGLSRLLDHIWARVLRSSWPYFLVSAPGVVVHECAHIIGCLITGAKIKKVVLISREGGMVTYAPPAIPLFGNVIISTAPLFFLPLVLAALTWVFGNLRLRFLSAMPSLDSAASLYQLISMIGQTLYQNLFVAFNGWFLLYLYLVTSLVLSFSPSMQDLKNAVVGILILIIAGFCILLAGISALTVSFLRWLTCLAPGLRSDSHLNSSRFSYHSRRLCFTGELRDPGTIRLYREWGNGRSILTDPTV